MESRARGQGHDGGQAKGVVDKDRKPPDEAGISHAGQAPEDQRDWRSKSASVIRSRCRLSMVRPGEPDQGGHGQHVDDGDDKADENAETRNAGFP